MTERKVVGRAKAVLMGQYPTPAGHPRIVRPDEEFDLLEGLEKGRWFEVLELAQPEPKPEARTKPGPRPASVN